MSKTNTQILQSYGYKLVTAEDFALAKDVPEGLRERAAAEGLKPGYIVIYDPEDDAEGWMLVGSADVADELARETVERRCTEH